MQQIEFGEGQIKKLKAYLDKEKPNKIMVLHGSKSFEKISSFIDDIIPLSYECFLFTDSYITFNILSEGLNYYNANNFDCIIAIGGGAIMDFAKLISIFSNNNHSISDYVNKNQILNSRDNLLILIPTTAGSGSEATQFAVLYNGITKYSISNKSLLADYVIIDPELTYTLSPYQTAVSGMDALCQGIESLWSLKSTPTSRISSIESISLIANNIETAVLSKTRQSRSNMSRGSYLAGKSINLAKTTAAHAMSYPMTRLFGIPHGHSVALTIGSFIEFNSHLNSDNISDSRGIKHVLNELEQINKLFNVKSSKEARIKINSLMDKIGLERSLSQLGINDEEILKITENLNSERLSNNPRRVEKRDARNILKDLINNGNR